MSKLSTSQRNNLPASKFSGPGRSFPITDAGHAKAALIDVNRAKGLTSNQKSVIRSKAKGLLDRVGK